MLTFSLTHFLRGRYCFRERTAMSVRRRSWTNKYAPKGEAWVVNYTDQNGRRRLKSFDRKEDADAFHTNLTFMVHQIERMSDNSPNNIVLHLLREIDHKIEALIARVDQLTGRVLAVEQHVIALSVDIGNLNQRMATVETRLDRIERHLSG